jgi:SAM-dependent methyltransferase
MSDWQERITRDTAPAIRVEHELRYRVAAPLIAGSSAWADLGCGNGLAAAAALEDARPARIVLVDVEREVVARAAGELSAHDAQQLAGDLTNPEDLQRIGEALLGAEGEVVVTCFEVVEHLDTFLPLLEWSSMLAGEHGVTFVISVPNDAFWAISNPHHRTAWGEGAFEELRRLLPAEQTLLRQVALAGSALLDWDASSECHDLATAVGGDGTIATHFIAAFGPRHDQMRRCALAVQTDMIEQRRWERQRENNLALLQHVTREQSEALQERTVWFEEWRTYIHELERELGRPLSGVSPEKLPEHAEPPA